jgi:hypothetical protein
VVQSIDFRLVSVGMAMELVVAGFPITSIIFYERLLTSYNSSAGLPSQPSRLAALQFSYHSTTSIADAEH